MKTPNVCATAAVTTLVVIGAAVHTTVNALFGAGTTHPSHAAVADIPADYLTLYQAAAPLCPGLDWSILAAIGKVETDHGRSPLPGVHHGENHAGAGGPMQFLAATFTEVITRHTLPPGGAEPPSRYHPHDAIHAASHYLCDNGASQGDLRAAIWAYNHSDDYVNAVLTQATAYAETMAGSGDCNAVQAPNEAAFTAINYACGQLGLPYVWGGDGIHEGGYDCSGLTKAAYAAADIPLPRTAQTQYDTGPHVPLGQPLLPGDLVFYGTPDNVHHVGLYIGNGHMINAPDFGQPVQIDNYRYDGDDYAGATRPTTSGKHYQRP
ncbi:NlpC/P60 family protein [Saccharothrix saharensis]|uniref:C40 family peptidase n=1 Tax=Saccharothrix saharensis TaxID=571190 RepID=UPI0036AA5A8D